MGPRHDQTDWTQWVVIYFGTMIPGEFCVASFIVVCVSALLALLVVYLVGDEDVKGEVNSVDECWLLVESREIHISKWGKVYNMKSCR